MRRALVLTPIAAAMIVGCGDQGLVQRRAPGRASTLLVRVCGPYIDRHPVAPCHRERIAVETVNHSTVRVTQDRSGPSDAARMIGVVWVCGDPTPRPPTPPIQAVCALQDGRSEVRNPAGWIVARQRLNRGRFAITVPPGRYTLETWNSGNGPWKEQVDVLSGETARIAVTIRAI